MAKCKREGCDRAAAKGKEFCPQHLSERSVGWKRVVEGALAVGTVVVVAVIVFLTGRKPGKG